MNDSCGTGFYDERSFHIIITPTLYPLNPDHDNIKPLSWAPKGLHHNRTQSRHSHHLSLNIMSWPYKKVLIIGATSGIGEALAIRCVNAGSNVIVTGRRQERLADFVHKYGKDKASAITLDITELSRIPDFAKRFV